ncbi:hypothetical protein F5148DRAFT_459841 [Russula earlei]|uniref:Uncharacterized protein n=1 Tax=Russula earlei TaxID=71964 RepID=A0ACC0TZY4_9AGAM|nr:hypothetical protein F5148DRAFT_459841 [Russula earlei]
MASASSSHSHPRPPYEYLDALLNAIPHDSVPQEIASPSRDAHLGPNPYLTFIDMALRLASNGPARSDDAPRLRDAWSLFQASVQHALHSLHTSSSSSDPPTKRKRSPSPPSASTATNKNPKNKHGDGEAKGDVDTEDDVPHLTLHALSATAPVRHKVDVTLHARTLRLTHSATGAPSALCARTTLTRAFLLPTRARSSGVPQWTALLLAGDKPAPPAPRGAGAREAAKAAGAPAARFELACSVPDSSGTKVPRMTVHPPASASALPSPPFSSREALLALLSSTIADTPATLTTVERGTPLAGVTAFRGVRETSLWFLDGASPGVLADGRPAEFWAAADLARDDAGIRVRSATGRTCSVVLMRRGSAGGNGGEDEEEEEEEGEETEFQMIDGKEREGILEWGRRHHHAFGMANVHDKTQAAEGDGDGQGEGGGRIDMRRDSDSDSDFEVESGESDGGSPSSSSGSDAGSTARHGPRSEEGSESGGDGDGDGDDNDDDDGSEHGSQHSEVDDDDDDGAVALDPKHHPLLRTGVLPKMSRAAMDVAVGLVVGDLVGQAPRGAARPAPEPANGRSERERGLEDEGDDEEDELED